MPRLSSVAQDPQLETEGTWVTFANAMRFKVARIGNPAHEEMLRRLREPVLPQIRAGTQDKATQDRIDEIGKRAASVTILKDWENVTDEQDRPIAYTPEVGFQTFMDPRFTDVYNFVMGCARDELLYRARSQDDARKNSSPSSSGVPDGQASRTS